MKFERFPSFGQFLLIAVGGFAVVLAPLVRSFLPERFLLDDGHLRLAIVNPGYAPEDKSFHVLAQVYNSLGIGQAPAIASTLTILVLVFCVLLAIGFGDWDRVGIVGMALMLLTFGLGLAYLAQYTKELVTLFVALVVLLATKSSNEYVRAIVIIGSCLLYGALVRPYWMLIAALIPCVWFSLRRISRPLLIIGLVVIAYIGLDIAFEIVRGDALGATREWVNSARTEGPVATLISAPDLGTGPGADVVAILIVAFWLLIPIPLFAMASPYYLVAGAAIVGLWSIVAVAIVRRRAREDSRIAWTAAVLVSVFLVLVIFEPDYGSYLKHLTPLLPLFLALVPLRARGHEKASRSGPAAPEQRPNDFERKALV